MIQDDHVICSGFRHDEAKVRKAYFRLAQKYHPDKNPEGRVRNKIVTNITP